VALNAGFGSFHRRALIQDSSQVGEARRAVELEAQRAGFDATHRGRAAIVATEIATNIARHTRGGEILYAVADHPEGLAMEILGIDRGPGMADPDRCLSDGYSTSSTPGNGLGAIRRQSEEFDLYSSVERGSVVMSRTFVRERNKGGAAGPPLVFGGVCVPHPGEPVSGDVWRVRWNDGGYSVLAVDGLGHGLPANAAAERAAEIFEESPFLSPAELVERIHHGLHGTRGATVAVARFHADREQLSYSGIGNIFGRLLSSDGARGLISMNGTAGVQVGKILEFAYDCRADAVLVMHSDGLQSRWEATAYPGLATRHPALLAATLYRDFQRGRDDISVVAARWSPRGQARGIQ
jgi:anti-sigma regulatory factor (Ser/Thr protein kinase)